MCLSKLIMTVEFVVVRVACTVTVRSVVCKGLVESAAWSFLLWARGSESICRDGPDFKMAAPTNVLAFLRRYHRLQETNACIY